MTTEWEWDGDCPRCNTTINWLDNQDPEGPDDAICNTCAWEELKTLREKVLRSRTKGVLDWAKSYDSKLEATDLRFRGSVTITHSDGSFFYFTSAFALKHERSLLVFTQNNKYHVYKLGDLVSWYALGPILPILDGFSLI